MLLAETWLDIKDYLLSEVSETEKEKYYYDITYMWALKTNDTN